MNEMVTFQLIIACCKHLLTCACEFVKFNHTDLSQLWIELGTLYSGKYLKLMTRIIYRQLEISMDINTRKIKYISKLKKKKRFIRIV